MASKLTRAKEVSEATKKAVLERQNFRSISGVYLVGKQVEYHHFISRGCEGIGAEWNICAITKEEHRAYHDGANIKVNGADYYTSEEFKTLMRNHLILNYCNWSEEACKYKKFVDLKDYGVKRRNESKYKH